MAANGAQFGAATVHYYWIGAVPAMVFLGIVMMPFYYGSKVRSVPEYLRLRFNRPTHLFNALSFAFATVLIAGVNLYALALVLELLLGWPILLGIVVVRRDRARLHHARRPLLGDLQRGPAVLHHPRGARPARARRPARRRRLGGDEGGAARVAQGRRGLPARVGGHGRRQRHQPARGVLDPDRLRPRLRALLRLLDDELRRGPARAVGQGAGRRPPHAADRRLPEDLHPVHHGHPRPGGADRDPRPRLRRTEHGVQQRDPAADERVPARTGCSGWRSWA